MGFEKNNPHAFKEGDDARRGGSGMGRGRPHGLADPERLRLAAELFAAGATREEMSEALGISVWTVTQWRKDARVKAAVSRIAEDRVLRITSKIDSAIMGRLSHIEKLDIDTLLKIRKEFLGGVFRTLHEGGAVDDQMITDTAKGLEDMPEEDRAKLRELLGA
jgi:hypothetical protein